MLQQYRSAKLNKARYQLVEQLAAWVEDSGFTQREAAQRLDVHQPIVHRLLQRAGGHGISLSTLLEMWERIGGTFTLAIKAPNAS